MGLTFEEALVGATINAAWSVGRQDVVGSLEVGKALDAVVVNGPAVHLLRVGTSAIRMVIKGGKVVYEHSAPGTRELSEGLWRN